MKAESALGDAKEVFSFQIFTMDTLWLGYDDLDLPFREIAAVLLYQPALDGRIVHAYGSVPRGVRSVVVTAAGAYLPARLPPEQVRRRWAAWRVGE